MKITKSRLKQITQEEATAVLNEGDDWYDDKYETLADRKFDRDEAGEWPAAEDTNLQKAIETSLASKPSNFLESILDQILTGKTLSTKQIAIVKKFLVRHNPATTSLFKENKMKITESQLKKIIKEEVEKIQLEEGWKDIAMAGAMGLGSMMGGGDALAAPAQDGRPTSSSSIQRKSDAHFELMNVQTVAFNNALTGKSDLSSLSEKDLQIYNSLYNKMDILYQGWDGNSESEEGKLFEHHLSSALRLTINGKKLPSLDALPDPRSGPVSAAVVGFIYNYVQSK